MIPKQVETAPQAPELGRVFTVYTGDLLDKLLQCDTSAYNTYAAEIQPYLTNKTDKMLWLEQTVGTDGAYKTMLEAIKSLPPTERTHTAFIYADADLAFDYYREKTQKRSTIPIDEGVGYHLIGAIEKLVNEGYKTFFVYDLSVCYDFFMWLNLLDVKEKFLDNGIKIVGGGKYSLFAKDLLRCDIDGAEVLHDSIRVFTPNNVLMPIYDKDTFIKLVADNLFFSDLLREEAIDGYADPRNTYFTERLKPYVPDLDIDSDIGIYDIPTEMYDIVDFGLSCIIVNTLAEKDKNTAKKLLKDRLLSLPKRCFNDLSLAVENGLESKLFFDMYNIGAIRYQCGYDDDFENFDKTDKLQLADNVYLKKADHLSQTVSMYPER